MCSFVVQVELSSQRGKKKKPDILHTKAKKKDGKKNVFYHPSPRKKEESLRFLGCRVQELGFRMSGLGRLGAGREWAWDPPVPLYPDE